MPASGGTPVALSAAFDEDPSIVAWQPGGIFFAASAHTYAYLYKLDPDSKAVTKISTADQTVNAGFSFSKDGGSYACLRADAKTMPEVYVVSGVSRTSPEKKLTDLNSQTASWTTSTLEVVSWKSQHRAAL